MAFFSAPDVAWLYSGEGRDLRGPLLRVLMGILAHQRRMWLVKERQIGGLDIHDFKLGGPTLLREFTKPSSPFVLTRRPPHSRSSSPGGSASCAPTWRGTLVVPSRRRDLHRRV